MLSHKFMTVYREIAEDQFIWLWEGFLFVPFSDDKENTTNNIPGNYITQKRFPMFDPFLKVHYA